MEKYGTPQFTKKEDGVVKVGSKKFGECCQKHVKSCCDRETTCDCGNEIVVEKDNG
jgi:hypothetical protein